MTCWKCLGLPIGYRTPTVYKKGKCAVCVGADNDHSEKQVYFCQLCNEWLCDACTPRLFDRGFEALKKLFRFK